MKKATLLFLVVFAGFFAVNQSFSAIDGLIGLWTFDSASDKKVVDSTGKGHDGELVGSATIDANGKFGSALSCDGTEGYFTIPDNPDFEFSGDFSIACWVFNNTPPADNTAFVTKGYSRPAANGGDAKPWYIVYFVKTSGTIDFFLRDTKSVNSRAVGKTLINDGKWHHVACLKAGDKVKVYIDGKEDGVADAVDAKYGENDQPLVFMVHYDRWLKGSIDEVAIFNKAITENEIATVMNGLASGGSAVDAKGKLAVTWSQLR